MLALTGSRQHKENAWHSQSAEKRQPLARISASQSGEFEIRAKKEWQALQRNCELPAACEKAIFGSNVLDHVSSRVGEFMTMFEMHFRAPLEYYSPSRDHMCTNSDKQKHHGDFLLQRKHLHCNQSTRTLPQGGAFGPLLWC